MFGYKRLPKQNDKCKWRKLDLAQFLTRTQGNAHKTGAQNDLFHYRNFIRIRVQITGCKQQNRRTVCGSLLNVESEGVQWTRNYLEKPLDA